MPGNKKRRKPKSGVVKGKVKKGKSDGEAWNSRDQQHEKSHKPADAQTSSQNRQPQKHGD